MYTFEKKEIGLNELETVAAGTDQEWAQLKAAIMAHPLLRFEWDATLNKPGLPEDADKVLDILNRLFGLDSSFGNGIEPIRFWQEGNWYHSYTFGQVMDMIKNCKPVTRYH